MKKRKLLLLFLEILILLGVFAGVFLYQQRAKEQDAVLVSEEEAAKRFRPSLTHDGVDYPLKRNTSSLLLIGTDNFTDDAKQLGEGFTYNLNMADFNVVLLFDHSAKTVTPLQLNRDTMCQVETLRGLKPYQLTFGYSMVTEAEGSKHQTETVERLLFDVPIDNYFHFTMDTVPLMNDLVGGVTVTLDRDIPTLGSEYVKGATFTLHGKDALRFVRARDFDPVDANVDRMANQRLYMTAFTEAARASMSEDQDFVTRAFKLVEKHIDTDLQVEGITKLVNNLCEYEILPVVTPSGTYQMGEKWSEFYLDPDSLWECVRSVFCA